MPKRPMGFPNPNFVQGQVSGSTPGTPVGGASQQLQGNQAMTHTGKSFPVYLRTQKSNVSCENDNEVTCLKFKR